jgi:hypothetical protein
MGTLPDLDTGNISYISYWNAIDQGGVGSIDPEEALSNGNIQSYTLYDNGYTLKFQSTTGRTIDMRIKTDGWIVAHIDRSNDYIQSTNSKPRGRWDIINDWTNGRDGTITNNSLERAIRSLAGSLDNFGSMTYNSADVGLYNYEYPDSQATTFADISLSTSGSSAGPVSGGLSYTSTTTIYAADAVGSRILKAAGNGGTVEFEGTTVYTGYDSNNFFGSLNITGNGLMPNSGTEYQLSVSADPEEYAAGYVIVIWG